MEINPSYWVDDVIAIQTKDLHGQILFPSMNELVLDQSKIKAFQSLVASLHWSELIHKKIGPNSWDRLFIPQAKLDHLVSEPGGSPSPSPSKKKLVTCVFGWLRVGLSESPAFEVALRTLPKLLTQYSTPRTSWIDLANKILFLLTEKLVASRIKRFITKISRQHVINSYFETKCVGSRVFVANPNDPSYVKSATVTRWHTTWTKQGIVDPHVTLECDDGSVYSIVECSGRHFTDSQETLFRIVGLEDALDTFIAKCELEGKQCHFIKSQKQKTPGRILLLDTIMARCELERERKRDLLPLLQMYFPDPIVDLCMSYSNIVYDTLVVRKGKKRLRE